MKLKDITGGLIPPLRRRDLIAMLVGAAMYRPNGARAQQHERIRRVGMLVGVPPNDPISRPVNDALIDELKHLGWTQGGTTGSIFAPPTAAVQQVSA